MYSLYFDGASKHNPGQAACGAVLYDENNTEVDYCCNFAYILLFIPMFYYSKDNF